MARGVVSPPPQVRSRLVKKEGRARVKAGRCCAERVSGLDPMDLFIKHQYCPSEQSSTNRVLLGLVFCGYVRQLFWSGPGPTLWYMEREAAEQIGGVQ